MNRFRVFKKFNKEELWLARWRRRIDEVAVERLEQRGRVRQVLEALAAERSIKVKEVLESFEVYACVHKRLNHKKILDLCCGHGFTGLLFAIFNPEVEQVWLLDREESPSARTVGASLMRAFPELEGRVRRITCRLQDFDEPLDADTGLIAVHACGSRTDRCLDLAIKNNCAIVAMPCCYTGTGKDEPLALRKSLGVRTATDVGRTYRLRDAGYLVDWEEIPEAITPMNRVIIAHPNGTSPAFQKGPKSDNSSP